MQLQSTNPLLTSQEAFSGYLDGPAERRTDATMSGIINKTGILSLLVIGGGVAGYSLAQTISWLPMATAVASFVIVLGMGFVLRKNPKLAASVGWAYSLIEGLFLGSITAVLDGYLAGLAPNSPMAGISLAIPAMAITGGVLGTMLVGYRAGLIKPTKRFKAVLGVATGGIFIAYLAMFALSFFGINVPFLGLQSATGAGAAPLIGLGLNLVILGVASLWLIIDFEKCEQIAAGGQPKYMEWFAAVGLIVTLAWIYYEALKLAFRLAIMFSSRD